MGKPGQETGRTEATADAATIGRRAFGAGSRSLLKSCGLRRYVVSVFPRIARRQQRRCGSLSKTPFDEPCADALAAMRAEQRGAPLGLARKLFNSDCNGSAKENRCGSQHGKFFRDAPHLARSVEDRGRT